VGPFGHTFWGGKAKKFSHYFGNFPFSKNFPLLFTPNGFFKGQAQIWVIILNGFLFSFPFFSFGIGLKNFSIGQSGFQWWVSMWVGGLIFNYFNLNNFWGFLTQKGFPPFTKDPL